MTDQFKPAYRTYLACDGRGWYWSTSVEPTFEYEQTCEACGGSGTFHYDANPTGETATEPVTQ